jgi:DNA helicase-2/ATP-dependent DNA helicase PcrA
MSAIDYQHALNSAQLQAVTSTDGAHLVIAGAGSGKTRTLVYRVAYLVEQGIPPESILLLTFTRRSAQEMLRRATSILDERCRRVAGGTYHGFANQVLRRNAKHLEYSNQFTITDRGDANDLMGILRTEGGFETEGKRFPRADLLINLISKEINTHRPLEELLEEEYPQFLDDLKAITTLRDRYAERKKAQNVMDYDDLLVNLKRLLMEHPRVRQRLGSTYRYIMVDEYQDTNRLQAQIAALLAADHGNIMVVGDDAQSIYSFRGANFRNIMDFPKIFADCETILLEQNYRSSQPILDLGNAILENAKEKFSKKLFTLVAGQEKPVFIRTTDDYSQARFVCERVLALREEGVPLGEMAVLARAAWHSNMLEVELRARNIPFRKFGGIRFVEAAHVKDVCAILKIAINPTDTAAWFRILQFFEGVGPKTAQKIAQAVSEDGGNFLVLTEPPWSKRRYSQGLERLVKLLTRLSAEGLNVSDCLDITLEEYRTWMPRKYDDVPRRLRDLEALQVIATRYEDTEDFLSDLAIDPPEFVRLGPHDDTEDEWMTISTVHSAKGLEWQAVFVLQMNAGRFPNFNTMGKPEDFEEERRILYVAVTRAKQNLYLLKPEEVASRSGYYEVGEMSPLLTEIKGFKDLVEEQVYTPEEDEDFESPDNTEVDADAAERMRQIQDYFS